MAIYKHGTYGEFAASIGRAASNAGTVAVYVGTAPVNLIRGYADADVVNAPAYLANWSAVQRLMGYSSAWEKFTLCEAFKTHFKGEENVGPIVAINVLDPATHKAAEEVTEQLAFVNGRATIKSDTIILDTLVLADKVEGTDYSLDYDFTKGHVVIDSIGASPITGTVAATFSVVDPAQITAEDIIGGVTAAGEYSGLGCVALVYQTLNIIPNLLAAPGWSHDKAVYDAMIVAATKINGHWDAFAVADIPLADSDGEAVDTIEKAIAWKSDNGFTSERAKVCWPKVQNGAGEVYHLSTLYVWRQMLVDATHDGVPMESASNKQIPATKQYFGADSKNRGFDQQRGNDLNAEGITTAVFFGGIWVLWGPHTAAFKHGAITDNRVIFDNSIRTMMHITNSFQSEWALTIDQPMTRAMADTIMNREQEKADALVAMGALIGTPVVIFTEGDNSTDELVQGNFVWSFEGTPTPPFKSGTLKVAYTTDGFDSYLGEEA